MNLEERHEGDINQAQLDSLFKLNVSHQENQQNSKPLFNNLYIALLKKCKLRKKLVPVINLGERHGD